MCAVAQGKPSNPTTAVASRVHLLSVVLILLLVVAATLWNSGFSQMEFKAGERLPTYLRIVASEWLLALYVWIGVRRWGGSGRDLIAERSDISYLREIGIGVAASVVWMAIGFAIMSILRPNMDEVRVVQSFLPRSDGEKLGFAALSLTASFCEEFIYRGYLQQQFRAWAGCTLVAALLQASLFGLMHLALPWKFVISVVAMAIFLGGVVAWRKTLVPAMFLHAAVNLFGGLFSST